MSDAFWIEHEHDRQAASDGVSRYGAYVGDRIPGGFDECWDGTYETRLAERFAAKAWAVARGPIMAPPYVDEHPDVLAAKLHVDYDDDAGLIAGIELASRWPQPLGRGWDGTRHWWPWPREHSFTSGDYPRNPYGEETARHCYALASLRLVFAVPSERLPAPPGAQHKWGEVEQTARAVVAVLVAELNQVVNPVLRLLERA
jgi:hypothetical protein